MCACGDEDLRSLMLPVHCHLSLVRMSMVAPLYNAVVMRR